MDELLFALETQTASALGLCADGKPCPVALLDARRTGIVHLCDLIGHGALISATQLERIRTIEKGGGAIIACVQETRDGFRESLRIAARQKSFSRCIEAVLDLPRSPELLTDTNC